MNNRVFTRKVPLQIKAMFICVLMPLYMRFAQVIVTAFLKFVVVNFHMSVTYAALNSYLNFLVDGSMVFLVALVMKDFMKEQWVCFKENWKSHIVYGLVIGFVLLMIAKVIGFNITQLLGGENVSVNQDLIDQMTSNYPWIMSISSVFFAPILEEMLFRGIMFGWIYEINPKLAYVFTGFFFGFIHVMISVLSGNLSEFVQIFSYFFSGLVLCYLYEKTNDIYVPILTHMLNNLFSMIIILFM